MLGSRRPFYEYVREERLFCATLAHLLLARGGNLAAFLEFVRCRSGVKPDHLPLPAGDLDSVEVYVEFSFLRDRWYDLGRLKNKNEVKRQFILDSLARALGIDHFLHEPLPESIPGFNAYFVGERGRSIRKDIVYPGQWSVLKLYETFRRTPEAFRLLCMYKWAFNIKPDLVILSPVARPLCIEAKLESEEDLYPSSHDECKMFDDVFGRRQRRVGQLELQRFMFEVLLEHPATHLVIGRDRVDHTDVGIGFVSWQEVFGVLDSAGSIPFVQKLIHGNEHLRLLTGPIHG